MAIFVGLAMMVLPTFVRISLGSAQGSGSYAPDFSFEETAQSTTPLDTANANTMNDTERQDFQKGYACYTKEKYQKAATHFFRFIIGQSPDVVDYEWAEFFFGISLYKLGYTHAAVDTLTHLVTRKPNPQIVGYALELMEKISRSLPYDRNMLIYRTLCDHSYDFIYGPVADFIHYYQGEYDWERGLFNWGDKHFSNIPEESYYYYKYLFARSLRQIYDNRIDEAISGLKTILGKLENGNPLKDDTRKTLARLYYENGDFAEADFLYQQLEMNIVDQAQTLLERAWTHYRMGNPERAMGLLYSFEAPSCVNAFTPEFYILKSFIYKDVCHYQAAMKVLSQFETRYGKALGHIYKRKPIHDNEGVLLVLLNKPTIKRKWEFINLLEKEQNIAISNPDKALQSYLTRLYTLKRQEMEQQFRILLNDAYEKMANAMLQYEEEAHLMEYEIGMDMYQRVSSYHFEENSPDSDPLKLQKNKAVYAFQGEFWNDELDDYEVELPNKCQNAEEWDIFFK